MCILIVNEYQIAHDILKESVQDMSLKQIQNYAINEIESLMANLEQQNIHSLLDKRLNLQDEWESKDIEPKLKSNESVLFTDLASLKHFPHKKGKQYSNEQISEFGDIIRKYPNNLSVIRKGLKIPSSSFQRLLKNWEAWTQNNTQSERKSFNQTNLNDAEQMYIAKLLKPPTYPTSIPQI